MYQCRLGTQQQKRSFAEKVLRFLVDSKSTCASNVLSGQTRPTAFWSALGGVLPTGLMTGGTHLEGPVLGSPMQQ